MTTQPMGDSRVALANAAKGWLHDDEGPFLRELALRCHGPFLEVGSYCGKSTVWIGDAAETRGEALFCVDHHQGSPEMAAGSDCHDPSVIDGDGAHDTLIAFRRTIRAADLTATVIPVVASTELLGPLWMLPVGFVFIDAAHTYEGCKLDARTWLPWVNEGGLVAFHDTTIPDIARVVDEATAEYQTLSEATPEGSDNGVWAKFDEVKGCNTIRVLRRVR